MYHPCISRLEILPQVSRLEILPPSTSRLGTIQPVPWIHSKPMFVVHCPVYEATVLKNYVNYVVLAVKCVVPRVIVSDFEEPSDEIFVSPVSTFDPHLPLYIENLNEFNPDQPYHIIEPYFSEQPPICDTFVNKSDMGVCLWTSAHANPSFINIPSVEKLTAHLKAGEIKLIKVWHVPSFRRKIKKNKNKNLNACNVVRIPGGEQIPAQELPPTEEPYGDLIFIPESRPYTDQELIDLGHDPKEIEARIVFFLWGISMITIEIIIIVTCLMRPPPQIHAASFWSKVKRTRFVRNVIDHHSHNANEPFVPESKGRYGHTRHQKFETSNKNAKKSFLVGTRIEQRSLLETDSVKIELAPTTRVFPDPTYSSRAVPGPLMTITVADVPAILGSYKTSNMTRAVKREFIAFRHTWSTQSHPYHDMKMFLIDNWEDSGRIAKISSVTMIHQGASDIAQNKEGTENKFLNVCLQFDGITFNHDNTFFMHSPYTYIDADDYEFYYPGHTNFIYELLKDPSSSRVLKPQRIRSILKSLCKPGATYDDVVGYFEKECKTVKSFKNLDRTRLYWMHCYITPEWLNLNFPPDTKEVSYLNKAQELFRTAVSALRHKVLLFVKQYYRVFQMENYERKQFMKEKAIAFAKIMRTPEIQMMFAAGTTKEEICENIYRHFNDKVIKDASSSKTLVHFKKKLVRRTQVAIHKSRDFKDQFLNDRTPGGEFINQEEFIPESLSDIIDLLTTLTPLTAILATVLPALALFTTYSAPIKRRVLAVMDGTDKLDRALQKINTTTEAVTGFFEIDNLRRPESKVLMLEIKTVIHILFHVYNGDMLGALEWATNFFVTRSIDLMDMLSDFNAPGFRKYADEDPTVEYQGLQFTIPKADHATLVKVFEDHGSDSPEYAAAIEFYCTPKEIILQSYDLAGDLVVKLLARMHLINMDDFDVRAANNQFTYVNHVKREVSDNMKGIMTIMSVVTRMIYNYDPFDNDYNMLVGKVTEIVNQTSKFKIMGSDIANKKEDLDRIAELHTQTKELMLHPNFPAINPHVRQLLAKAYSDLEGLARLAHQFQKGVMARAEPICVLLTGPPKVGKSATVDLCKHALSYIFGNEFKTSMVFTYNGGEYFESYRQQDFVVMDDAFKSTDKAQRSLEAQVLINMVNTAPFCLNMAFGDKGVTYFDSKYIFVTTNVANDGIDRANFCAQLTDEEALKRRFGLVLHKETPLSYGMDLAEQEYVVHQCIAFPEYKGRTLKVREIPKLIAEIRVYLDNNHKRITYSKEYLGRMFTQHAPSDTTRIPLIEEDQTVYMSPPERVVVQAGGIKTVKAHSISPDVVIQDSWHSTVLKGLSAKATSALSYVVYNTPLARIFATTPGDPDPDPDKEEDKTHFLYYPKLLRKLLAERQSPFGKADTDLEYILGNLTALVAVLATAATVYGIYSHLVDTKASATPESGAAISFSKQPAVERMSGASSSRRKGWKMLAARKLGVMPGQQFHPQSLQENYLGCLYSTICKSTFLAKAVSTSDAQTAIGFHVKDGYCCIPLHFYLPVSIGKNQRFTVTFVDTDEIEIPWPTGEEVCAVDGEDMMMFRLPEKMNKPRACYNYFVSKDEPMITEQGLPLDLICLNDSARPVFKRATRGQTDVNTRYDICGVDFAVKQPITYWGNTAFGDSGALICVQGPQGRPTLIGMHTGKVARGKSFLGVGIPYSKEFFDTMLEAIQAPIVPEGVLEGEMKVESNPRFAREFDDVIMMMREEEPLHVPHVPFEDATAPVVVSEPFPLEILYRVPPCDMHIPPTRSRIKKSRLWGCFGEAKKAPANLGNKPGEPNKMFKSVFKLHQKRTPAKPYNKDKVMAYLKGTFPRPSPRSKIKGTIVPWDEALRGDPKKGSMPICYSTSAGYKYSKNMKGKTGYLVKRADLSYDYDPEFFALIEKMDDDLQRGINVDVIYADFLKDETRPIAKVEKPRLVTACQIHYLFLMRRRFLDFITYLQSLCVTHPAAPGINVHSVEYTQLYYRLRQTDDSVIAGDFSNFDGKLPAYIGEVVIEFINWWYNDGADNARARDLLAQHIYTAKHIVYDIVYQVVDGNPSGNPLTTVYNTMCNIIMCYIVLTEDLGVPETDFNMTMYGDDNVITVNNRKLKVSDLTPFFKERFDLDYTHFSKAENEEYDTMHTISFLGRKFRLDRTFVKAPLDLDIILQSVYYVSTSLPEHMILLDTSRSFFAELSHHPYEIFEKYSQELCYIMDELFPEIADGVRANLKTYYYYEDMMYHHPGIEKLTPESRDLKPHEVNSPIDPVSNTDGSRFAHRAVNKLSTTRVVQLGSYMDSSEVSETAVSNQVYQPLHQTINMETFNLDNTIAREYLIATVPWTEGQTTNTVLTSVQSPQALFDKSYIFEKITGYEYFQAGIRVTVNVSADKFSSGKLMLTYRPNKSHDYWAEQEAVNVQRRSADPHILISASASEAVAFDVPFISRARALKISSYTADELGIFELVVLNPLRSCNSEVSTAQVFVTAQFLEPRLFLPTDFIPESKQEAALKTEKGSISDAFEKADTILGVVEDIPFVGSYASAFRMFTRTGKIVSSIAGLSKPSTLARTEIVKVDPFSDMYNGQGMDLTPALCTNPENRTTAAPCVGGINYDEMDLVTIAGTPKLVQIVELTSTSAGVLDLMTISNDPDHNTFADFYANQFRYYVGSPKIKIYFTASLMQTARVIFYLTDDGFDDWQQCYHQVVDITGDTEYAVTLPYIEKLFARNTAAGHTHYLAYRVVSWSQPNDEISCRISMNIYKAMANDVRFFGQIERMAFIPESNPRADFAQPFPPMHDSMTGFVPQGIVFGEEVTNLRQMLHKWYPYALSSPNVDVLAYENTRNVTGGRAYIGIEMLSLPFDFRNGAIRVKVMRTSDGRGMLNLLHGDDPEDNYIGASFSSSNNPLLEAQIPYFNPTAYMDTKFNGVEVYPKFMFAPNDGFIMKSTGDDYTLHFLGSYPPVIFEPVENTLGYQALRTYLST